MSEWLVVVLLTWTAISVLAALLMGAVIAYASRPPGANRVDRRDEQLTQLTQLTSCTCAVATSKTNPRTSSRCGSHGQFRMVSTEIRVSA